MKAIVMNSAGGCETLEYVERPPRPMSALGGSGRAASKEEVRGLTYFGPPPQR